MTETEANPSAAICSARYLVRVAELLMNAAERAREQPGLEIVLGPDDAETIGSAICMLLMPIVWAEMGKEDVAGHA